jgi:two-component system sensor histidine kinase/response regulator
VTTSPPRRGWLTRLRLSFALQLAAMLVAMGLLPLLWYFVASNRAIEDTILSMASAHHKAMLSNERDYLRLQTEQIEALAANLGQLEEIAKSLQAISDDKAATSFDHLATQARIGYLLSNYRNMKGLVSIDLFSLSGKHYRVGDSLTAVDERSGLRDQLLAPPPSPPRPWCGTVCKTTCSATPAPKRWWQRPNWSCVTTHRG